MKNSRPFIKLFGILICALLILFNFSPQVLLVKEMPSYLYVGEDNNNSFSVPDMFLMDYGNGAAVSSISGETLKDVADYDPQGTSNIKIKLFGLISVKTVTLRQKKDSKVVPGGLPLGVILYTKGILVVGTGEISTAGGQKISPVAAAGIQAGDVILSLNDIQIKDSRHLGELCNSIASRLTLTVLRKGNTFSVAVTPIKDESDGIFKLGMWVRDSTSGIGTLSFSHPETRRYSALGHSVTDIDTNTSIIMGKGSISEANIIGITSGVQGQPGELKGTFAISGEKLGTIEKNTEFGIYGILNKELINPLYPDGVQIAYPGEVKIGPAKLITTIDTRGMIEYDCSIIKLYSQDYPAQKGIVIKVTDPELIQRTGGIIQGMSGSPLMQDGKLVGIVTHVFLNDPQKGYAMYALWMENNFDF